MVSTSNKKDRSRAYPVMPLEEALVRIASINKNLGINGQFNRESIAVGMGYTSLNGASARRVAALVHYGFLNREKDQYSLSPLAKQYLLPVKDGDKEVAIRTAALSPALFLEIYKSFKGQVIPKQFVNRLVQEFGIQQKAAPDVERIFKSTVTTAGIMQSNGILSSETVSVVQSGIDDGNNSDDSSASTNQPATHSGGKQIISPSGYLAVNLPSGLIVSYSQDLASAFAFGKFGSELKALDDAVAKHSSSRAPAKSEGVDKEAEM
jgi:hypothetical protein